MSRTFVRGALRAKSLASNSHRTFRTPRVTGTFSSQIALTYEGSRRTF